MSNNTYNGWTNRETWVINIWLGDYFQEVSDEAELDADYIEEIVWEMFTEADIPPMFADMIDLNVVNWQELVDHYTTETEFQAEVA